MDKGVGLWDVFIVFQKGLVLKKKKSPFLSLIAAFECSAAAKANPEILPFF